MAQIFKPPKKKRIYNKHYVHVTHKYYNSNTWRKLRHAYLVEHPLCEECIKSGKVTPAEEVHHIKPISTGKTDLEMMSIAYDSNNLMSLCQSCHKKIHKNLRQNTTL